MVFIKILIDIWQLDLLNIYIDYEIISVLV